MLWVHENWRYGSNQGDLTETFAVVPFPSHSYLANVSLYFTSLKIQENSRTTLCKTQPDPYERLTTCLRKRVWQNVSYLSYFSALLSLSRFFETTITPLLNKLKICYSIKDWSMAKSAFLHVKLQNILLKTCTPLIFLALDTYLWEHVRMCWSAQEMLILLSF